MLHLLPIIIQVNVRENRRDNHEWKSQRNRQSRMEKSEKQATLGTIHRLKMKKTT